MKKSRKQAVFNWSGGKDSSLSLYYIWQQKEYDIQWLLTSVNQDYNRVSMHGVRFDLLKRQAESIDLPLYPLMFPAEMSMEMYNKTLAETCQSFVRQEIRYSIFGDIFLEDLRQYREEQLKKVNMQAVFPIWKRPTLELAQEFIRLGFKAVVVCVDNKSLSQPFAGREFDQSFLKNLPPDVDPCGENGEFHTFVYDGPIFKEPISVERGEIVYREYKHDKHDQNATSGFWYCDLVSTKPAGRQGG
jgi:uncharacterized protein (TIGR00290 family)